MSGTSLEESLGMKIIVILLTVASREVAEVMDMLEEEEILEAGDMLKARIRIQRIESENKLRLI